MLFRTSCKFCWIWMSNQFWIVIAITFISLLKSFPALSIFFDFYNFLLEVVKFPSEEYQHVLLVWWLYHLVSIYFYVQCSANVLCLSPGFLLWVPLWVHSAFKIINCIFLLDACFDRNFLFKPFIITWTMKFTLPNSRSNQNQNPIKPKIWRGSIFG